jgi:hypothetical protein
VGEHKGQQRPDGIEDTHIGEDILAGKAGSSKATAIRLKMIMEM